MKTTYRKNGKSNQIIALMLVLVLSIGQMALALANSGDIIDPNAVQEVVGNPADGIIEPPGTIVEVIDPNALQVNNVLDPNAASSDGSQTEFGAQQAMMSPMAAGSEPGKVYGTPPGVDVSLIITTEEDAGQPGTGGGVKHKQKINIEGTIVNGEVKNPSTGVMEPVLREGMSLTFHFPSYVVINDIGPGSPLATWLNSLITEGVLSASSGIQPGTNLLTLFFTNNPFVMMGFNIDLEVDVTKYNGDNDQSIELEFNDGTDSWWTGGGGGIHVDPGIPTEHGIQKMPFGNNFEYIGNGIYKIKDSTLPVEYRVGMNVPSLGAYDEITQTGDYFEIKDRTANYMKLCTAAGVPVTAANVAQAFVFDTPFPAGVTPIITLEEGADYNEFTIRVNGPMAGGQFVFRYYMKLELGSNAQAVSNKISINVHTSDPFEDYDEVDVLNASSNALIASKYINTGTEQVYEYAIPELVPGQLANVTFDIVMRQIMESGPLNDNMGFPTDYLRGYFSYVGLGTRRSTNAEHPFKLVPENSNRELRVYKDGSGKVKHGSYTLPFTVSVAAQEQNSNGLAPGTRGDNTIFGKTVYVYRNAQLRVKKIWDPGTTQATLIRGNTISFQLKDSSGNVLAEMLNIPVAATGDTEQVLFINYLNKFLKDGTNTYYFTETLESGSDYGTVAAIPVVITKNVNTGAVTFGASGSSSLTVDPTYAGVANVEFTNIPDDLKGSVQFTKTSTPSKVINGGEFELRYLKDRFGNDIPAASQLVSLVYNTAGYYVPESGLTGVITAVTRFGVVNSTVSIRDLDYGTYRITEVKAPDGFLKGSPDYVDFVLAKGTKYITKSMNNTFFNTGKIIVHKLAQDGTGINGVTFTLYKQIEGTSNYSAVANGTKVTATVGTAGYVEFTGLEKGNYRIDESVPEGLAGAGTVRQIFFSIDENGVTKVNAVINADGTIKDGTVLTGQSVELDWYNTKLYANIEILKIDETSAEKTPLSGATFTLHAANASGAAIGSVLQTKTTDATGKIRFENLEYGSYVVTETVVPAGYETRSAGATQQFSLDSKTVDANMTVSYTWGNPQKRGSIVIKKTSENAKNEAVALQGAVFGLYTYTGQDAPPDSPNPATLSLVKTATTDATGTASFTGLLKGTYYVHEISTMVGYRIGDDSYKKVVIGEGANADYQTVTLSFHNPREKREVKVIKKDEKGANLSGAVFYLTGNDFSNSAYTSADVTTNAQGEAVFANVPFGTYTIIERTPPEGYAAIENITGVVVNAASTSQSLTYQRDDKPLQLVVFKYSTDANKTPLKDADFIIRKGTTGAEYIEAETTGTPNVYKYKGLVTEANATHFVTPASGEFTITHLPAAAYNIYEKQAPTGFNPLTAPVSATVSATTEILRKEIANGTIRGNLQIVKTDKFGKLLSGMKFRITGPNGYDQTFITNSLGQINVSNLLFGDYLINEVDTPPEYAAIVDYPVTISEEGKTITVNLVNNPETGRVTINKMDNAGKPLGNAVFIMRPVGADGKVITTGVSYTAFSNAQGVALFSDIPYGYYAIQEQLSPNGFLQDPVLRYVSMGGAPRPAGLTDADVAGKEFVSGDTITWTNQKITGSLTVNKTDGTDARAGATFKLYYRDSALGLRGVKLTDTSAALGAGNYTFEDTVVENDATEFGTNAFGVAVIAELPYGIYELKEETAPDGLVKDTSTHVVTISDIMQDVSQTVVNPPVKGRLEVEKVDDATGDGLMGAIVRLYAYNDSVDPADYKAAAVLGEVTTNYAGKGSIENVPLGEYVAIEERAPANYALGSDADRVKRFTLTESTPNFTAKLQYRNNKLDYSLKIVKVDKDNKTVKLAGAKFKVINIDSGWGPDPETLVTNASGEVMLTGLAAGKYTVQEIEAPKGYALDPRVQSIEFGKGQEDSTGLITVTAENEKVIGSVELIKVDQDDKQLEGAEFSLLDEAGKTLNLSKTAENAYKLDAAGTVTSFKAGKVTISGLPMGKYEFKELAAPTNYAILATNYAFEVTAGNYKTVIKVTAQNVQQKATLSLRKVDNTNRNLSLPNAEFTLYSSADKGATYPTVVEKKLSNAAGYVIFTDLTEGYYQIMETAAPDGYQPWTNPIKFQVDADGKILIGGSEVSKDGEVYTVTVVNHKMEQQFRLRKVNSTTGAVLSGATFSLTGNGISQSMVTGADGYTPYVTLTPGTYTLTETRAPDGYQLLSGSNTVVVTGNGITVDGTALSGTNSFTLTVNNDRVVSRLMLYKTDSRSANPLSGATFSLTPRSGGSSITLTTDSNGQSNIVSILAGTYDIVETTAPSGYTRPLSGWTIQVSESGSATVSGSGITTWVSGGVIVVNITNTATTTSTPTPIPAGGGGGGNVTNNYYSSGGGTGSTSTTASPNEAIPLGPGLPQTGELTNTQALILGASLLLLSLVALLLFVALGGKQDDTAILPALI